MTALSLCLASSSPRKKKKLFSKNVPLDKCFPPFFSLSLCRRILGRAGFPLRVPLLPEERTDPMLCTLPTEHIFHATREGKTTLGVVYLSKPHALTGPKTFGFFTFWNRLLKVTSNICASPPMRVCVWVGVYATKCKVGLPKEGKKKRWVVRNSSATGRSNAAKIQPGEGEIASKLGRTAHVNYVVVL